MDFEFAAPPGERPDVVCLVARELRSGRLVRLWKTELPDRPPYPFTPDSVFVAFFATAELGCHLALDWPMPTRILDLFVEFRVMTNGRPTPAGSSLLHALAAFGLDTMSVDEKGEMRRLVLRGGPWSDGERKAILDYCRADVDALARLLPAMLPHILKRPPSPTVVRPSLAAGTLYGRGREDGMDGAPPSMRRFGDGSRRAGTT